MRDKGRTRGIFIPPAVVSFFAGPLIVIDCGCGSGIHVPGIIVSVLPSLFIGLPFGRIFKKKRYTLAHRVFVRL